MKLNTRSAGWLGLVLLTGVQVLTAQAPGPQMFRLTTAKVKFGMSADYIALNAEMTPVFKKAGVPMRLLWATTMFGEASTFATVQPFAKFADFDAGPAIRKVMGDTAYQQYLTRGARMLESVQYRAVRTRPDLSVSSGSNTQPGTALIATVVVAPGKDAAFEALVKSEVLPAIKRAGVKDFWAHQTMFGGNPNEYLFVSLQEKWAELDGGSPLVRGMGAEAFAAYRLKLAGIVESVKYEFSRVVPEASYMAP